MGSIEPDLLSTNVENLAAKYETQTPEERDADAERYRSAFDEYERQFAEYQQQWDRQLNTYKHQAVLYIEHESQEEETSQLQTLESSFDT